eukprot:14571128-Alexandrium_andersonii.AAC.1
MALPWKDRAGVQVVSEGGLEQTHYTHESNERRSTSTCVLHSRTREPCWQTNKRCVNQNVATLNTNKSKHLLHHTCVLVKTSHCASLPVAA